MSDDLLKNNGIVRGLPIGKETRLGRTDEPLKKGPQPISNDLCNNFVFDVIKSNGCEVPQVGEIRSFGDEAKIGGVYPGVDGGIGKSLSAEFNSGIT